MGVWKNSLGDMNTKTTYLKNDIQELYNHIKIGILQEIMCGQPSR